jgi:FtsP/CotA-like multicopper oxidase with cupredoxin domain
VDGEVQHQQAASFCEERIEKSPPGARDGFCYGGPPEFGFVNDYTGSRWYFPVSGQVFPTISITSSEGELWRLVNSSGQVSYRLSLTENTPLQTPILMQLISIDGVSIDVPPGTPAGTIAKIGGNKFTLADCPSAGPNLLPVCVSELIMMPSSRAEVWVAYRDASGNVVAPPPGTTATLRQNLINIGPVGEIWPEIKLVNVEFAHGAPARTAVDVVGHARTAFSQTGIFGGRAGRAPAARPAAPAARPAVACRPLPAGHRRRIFFGFVDPTDPNTSFGLGYEEVDQNGVVVPGTQRGVSAFDPTRTDVCLPLGPGGSTVYETWEMVNLATEVHNFHIHQTRFRIVQADGFPPASGEPSPGTAVIIEDNVPIPFAVAHIDEVAENQAGYCTIEQWRSGQCTSPTVVVDIPFSELGEFVYHCHIIEHGDFGMMAKIVVVPETSFVPTAHDFDGDRASDILWRHDTGTVAAWLMNGAQVARSESLGMVPIAWTIVGQRDFNGDGKSDVLWRDSSGSTAIWFLNGTQVGQSAVVGAVPASWAVVGTEDFNGDGHGDILWRSATGDIAIWFMNGAQIRQSAGLGSIPSSWTVVGAADFNGDGRSDILWRHSSGGLAAWLMNGPELLQAASLGTVPDNWTVAGTGDFNGDGQSDILWRDAATGTVAIWFMSGSQILQTATLGTVPADWTIIETGDFNRDAKSDILWRKSDGLVALWLMNGAQVVQAAPIATVATVWQIQDANVD